MFFCVRALRVGVILLISEMLLILVWGGNPRCPHPSYDIHFHGHHDLNYIWVMKPSPKYIRQGLFHVSAVQHVNGKADVVGFSGNRFSWHGSVNGQGESGGGMVPGVIFPLCLFWWGQATLNELSAHFEPPARLPWNIAAALPVCVHDQNKYELHTNKSRQLPCPSTEAVYWEDTVCWWLVSVDPSIW